MTRRQAAAAISTLCLLSLTAVLTAAPLPTVAARGRFPKRPIWWHRQWKQQKVLVDYVKQLNKLGTRLNLALYGDSIIIVMARNVESGANDWLKYFGNNTQSAALAVIGNNAEDLAWRLMKGGEVPRKCPKVVALYVGLTSAGLTMEETTSALERLVKWIKRTCPETKPVVMSLLRAHRRDTRPLNALYKAMAKRQKIIFANCGQRLSPDNPEELYDGEHPAIKAQNVMIRCLHGYVKQYI